MKFDVLQRIPWPCFLFVVAPLSAQDKPRFEVCVLGTLHAPWQFRVKGFTPAHIRVALAKIKPDVVGVESNPEWFAKGRFHVVTYEAQGIAIPFARKRSLPVYGVDWMDHDSWEARMVEWRRKPVQWLTTTARHGPLPKAMFGQQQPTQLEKLKAYFFQKDFDFAFMNGIGSDEYGKRWLRSDPKSKSFGGQRNRNIAVRCEEVMKNHPGKRLVVVIGAGHRAVLNVLFRQMQGVRLLRLGHEIPAPTPRELEEAWTADDLASALGHNLDGERSCFHRALIDVAHVRRLLERFAKVRGRAAHAHYFAARLALLLGDLDAAEESLARIDREPRPKARLYPFPMEHWRMVYAFPQAVRIARAELALARGRREDAAKLLAGLAETIVVPPLPADVETPVAVVKPLPVGEGWTSNHPDLRITARGVPLTALLKKTPAHGLSALVYRLEGLRSDERLTVAVQADGSRPSEGILEVYEPTPEGPRTLGSGRFPLGTKTSTGTASFKIRDKDRPLWVFLYFKGQAGTAYRLHKAEIQKVSAVLVPAHWKPRFLAREYPRTLLAH